MALYHLSIKAVSRSSGRSAVGAAAYRSGELIACDREGRVHDYTRKLGVEDSFILAPDGAPDWAQDRAALWNAAEAQIINGADPVTTWNQMITDLEAALAG